MIRRIQKDEITTVLVEKLVAKGFSRHKAEHLAEVFTLNSLQGVYSHGVNRFMRFIKDVKTGVVKVDAEPTLKNSNNALEQWDGNQGPGILNALEAVNIAMDLSDKYGMGCVAMANTNHWMRGGTYGRIAAEKGHVFIGWTNTMANLPAWGAENCKLGNNPLVIAAPGPSPIVIDMAMSQYSYGKLEDKAMKGELLDHYGGYNAEHQLSKVPTEILETSRPLPIGYWKGAGLSLLLDILATILSDGLSTAEISKFERETSVSQVFICINALGLSRRKSLVEHINSIITDYKESIPISIQKEIIFPSERTSTVEKENAEKGIPISIEVWDEILNL